MSKKGNVASSSLRLLAGKALGLLVAIATALGLVAGFATNAIAATKYVETDTFEQGKNYILVATTTGGDYAIQYGSSNNPEGTSLPSAKVTITEGSQASVEIDDAKLVWNARSVSNSGVQLYCEATVSGVSTHYLYPASQCLKTQDQGVRDIQWQDNELSVNTTSSGRYYITCDASGNLGTATSGAAKFRIFVEDDGSNSDPVAVTGVTLSQTSLSLVAGRTATLTATVAPSNATNKNVSWASDKPSVATVSNGTVTAVAEGTANITVTTADGNKTATCAVTVTAASVDPEPGVEGKSVLAFSSDVHNMSNNTSANRLGTWIDNAQAKYGPIELMGFCGDMADASASAANYWTYTQADMTMLETTKGISGVYTTGNHEHSPGNITSNNNAQTAKFKIGAEGATGDNYKIYCLGSASSSQSYSQDQISALTTYLNGAGNSKPIIILTHFPLHYFASGGGSWSWGGRSTTNASAVIEALNTAVTNNGQTIVFLWGHNHTLSDTYYDEIYNPGTSLEYASGSSMTLKFYYGAAGCMSDSEYGSGSASVKGKGLVIVADDVDADNDGYKDLEFAYLDENGTNISGEPVTPVAVTGVTLSSSTLSVNVGGSKQLTATVAPSNASNKSVTWSSSDTSVATVNSNGVVSGVKAGTATITVTTADGGKTATCTVTVSEPDPSATVTYELVDKVEAGKDYLIATGNSGSVYLLSGETGSSSSTLKGYAANVSSSKITIDTDTEAKTAYTAEAGKDADSFRLVLGGKYLYANNSGNLRLESSDIWSQQSGGSAANSGKYWHYKADNKYLLWFFLDSEDSSGSNGYNYAGSTYRYYIDYDNSGNFSKGTVTSSSTSIADTSTPKIYVYAKVDTPVTPVAVTGVTLDKTTASVETGKTTQLTATVAPSNATNKSVTWSSSDTSVATVDANGKVTGVKAGATTITVTTADGGKTATCMITVKDPDPTATVTYELVDKIEAGKEYLIATGNSGSVYLLSGESGSTNGSLKGYSATVADSKITLDVDTEAKVQYTTEAGKDADSVRLMFGEKYLYANNSGNLRLESGDIWSQQSGGSASNSGKYWHYKADNKYLLWFFLDSEDSSGSNGYNYAGQTYRYYIDYDNSGNFSKGTVTSTSTSIADTSTPKIYLYAKTETPGPAVVPVESVTLSDESLSLNVGDTATLTATIAPENATNKDLTWTSSDESVVTVDENGNITAVATGEAVIMVYSTDGPGNWCVVTVTDPSATKYTVTFLNYDGTELLTAEYPEGTKASAISQPDKVPTKPSDDEYDYKFDGWDPPLADVTADATYTATFTAVAKVKWVRLAGEGRYDTMQEIAQTGFESSEYAVLVTGKNFPDALSASALAGKYNCPVILTAPNALSKQAKEELERLGVRKVFIVGGEGSVSAAVFTEVSKNYAVERISGEGRQDTSIEVAKAVTGGNLDTIVVCSGAKVYDKKGNEKGFADALSIGPWCYSTATPIVLTGFNKKISDEKAAELKALGVKKVIVVGGTGSVDADDVAAKLGLDKDNTDQFLVLAGQDRYETSALVAYYEILSGMEMTNVSVATGKSFPDALAGAALCGTNNSVLILADSKNDVGLQLISNNVGIETGYVLGGENTVTPELMSYLESLTK